MNKTARFLLVDLLKSKTILVYTVLLFLLSWAILGLEDNYMKATLSLLNVVLLVVPLVSVVFATIYVYNSSEFIELLLSQPVSRPRVWLNLFLALSLALCSAFLIGCALPILIYSSLATGFSLIIIGLFLSLIFTALAMLCAVVSRDKALGIGLAIFIWLFFAVLYDGLLMVFMFQWADYPIEGLISSLAALNPIGLSRIYVLLNLDVAAMLGKVGAIFKQVFGSGKGLGISIGILCLWSFFPFVYSLMKFNKKDL